jgi:outer membrane protein TolC
LLRRVAETRNNYDKIVTRYNYLTGIANEIELASAELGLEMAQAQKADAERRYAIFDDRPEPDKFA